MTPRRAKPARGVTWRTLGTAGLLASLGSLLVPATAAVAASPAAGHVVGSSTGARVEVVVRAQAGHEATVERSATVLGARIERRIGIINGFSATIPQGRVAQLSSLAGVASVTPDAPLHMLSSTYTPAQDPHGEYNVQAAVGSRSQWSKGDDGAGIGVALIDSGVTPVEGLNNPGQVVYGPDLTEESQNPNVADLDTYGHGTFMAGIIAGRDPGINPAAAASDSKDFLGVAPGARIVSVKVADARGMTDVSQVIAGIDWVVQHAHDPGMNIRVLNLSFGTDSTQSYLLDPLAYAVEVAWRDGIVVVASAGNDGASAHRLTMPAADPFVIAVGAADLNGKSGAAGASIPSFSSSGNGVRNPDLVAPGNHMVSLRVPGSYIDDTFGTTGKVDSRYFRGSGTSEAAAFVSGSVAELLQARPYLNPDQVKAILTGTAGSIPWVSRTLQGAGVINVQAAGSTAPPFWSYQMFMPSTGLGSLDASRGSFHLVLGGVTLQGSEDIFGQAFNSAAMALAEATGTAWSGGSWNGSTWSGSTWSGSTWSNARWSGSTWSGSTWSGSTWSTADWSNGTWNGSTWSGSTWSGSTWSGFAWSGSTWSGSTWSCSAWSGERWA